MKKRGLGIASIFYGTGYGNGFPDISKACAELGEEGKIFVFAGATEVGQGAKTALSQIAAEAAGVELKDIVFVCEDTMLTPDSGTAAASRQTYNTGNGIRIACHQLNKEILEFAMEVLEMNSTVGLKLTAGLIEVKGLPEKNITLKQLYERSKEKGRNLSVQRSFTAHTTRMDDETGQGAPYWPYTFATFSVEVEVDTETGKVDVLRAVCAQDVGKAVNPTLIEGQMEGGFAMGMSWALYEDLGLQEGVIKNNNFSKYILPTSLDMPEIHNIIIEDPETTAPYGAKGIGEPVMIPAMPAILNAIYDAVGIRVTTLPASPQEILKLLAETEAERVQL